MRSSPRSTPRSSPRSTTGSWSVHLPCHTVNCVPNNDTSLVIVSTDSLFRAPATSGWKEHMTELGQRSVNWWVGMFTYKKMRMHTKTCTHDHINIAMDTWCLCLHMRPHQTLMMNNYSSPSLAGSHRMHQHMST